MQPSDPRVLTKRHTKQRNPPAQYWRMQLHPGDPDLAAAHAVQSLARGLVGFDFWEDPGDLTLVDPCSLPAGVHKHEVEFATQMQVGDKVLVLVHQYPFAVATIDSDYYYLRTPAAADDTNLVFPVLGVWFNHFRRVRDVKYYADWVKDPLAWEKFHKCATIQRITDPECASYKLIESWP